MDLMISGLLGKVSSLLHKAIGKVITRDQLPDLMLFYALDTLLVSLTVSHSPNPLLKCPSRNLQVVELGRIALGKHYCYGQAEAQACHCDYCLCR